jgi:hypothetical protein
MPSPGDANDRIARNCSLEKVLRRVAHAVVGQAFYAAFIGESLPHYFAMSLELRSIC